jgi:hypothetical protein
MNPLVYYALAVLCLCSIMTRRVWRTSDGGDTSTAFLYAIPLVSIWTIAASALASIGLASRTRAGMAFAGLVSGASAIACVWSVHARTAVVVSAR